MSQTYETIKPFIAALIPNEEAAEIAAFYISRDIDNIAAILTAPGTDEERKEAVVFGLNQLTYKLETSELIPRIDATLKAVILEIMADMLIKEAA